jgi:hypothetical protein
LGIPQLGDFRPVHIKRKFAANLALKLASASYSIGGDRVVTEEVLKPQSTFNRAINI